MLMYGQESKLTSGEVLSPVAMVAVDSDSYGCPIQCDIVRYANSAANVTMHLSDNLPIRWYHVLCPPSMPNISNGIQTLSSLPKCHPVIYIFIIINHNCITHYCEIYRFLETYFSCCMPYFACITLSGSKMWSSGGFTRMSQSTATTSISNNDELSIITLHINYFLGKFLPDCVGGFGNFRLQLT